jgi:hypothetical protein
MSKIAGRIGGRLLSLAGGKIQGIFRREINTGTRRIVILRANRNSGGTKIWFFAKSSFRMISAAPKNRGPGASASRQTFVILDFWHRRSWLHHPRLYTIW